MFPENLKDNTSRAQVTIDTQLNLIHTGKVFNHSEIQAVAAGANVDHLIVTPANISPHLRIMEISATGSPFFGYLYEGTTVSANGNVVTLINFNRTSTETSLTAVYEAPTITGLGNVLFTFLTTGSKQDGGVTDQSKIDFPLKTSTNYLVRFENNSGQTQNVCSQLRIYEHTI